MDTFQIKSQPNSNSNPNSKPNTSQKMQKWFLISQAALRTTAIAFTLIAIGVVVTSKQSILLFGFEIEAKYTYASAFKLYVGLNGAASFMSLVSLFLFLYSVRPAKLRRNKYFTMFLIDLMVVVLTLIGTAAASAVGYIGRYGNSHSGWMPICDHFGRYCNKVMGALVCSYVSSMLFIVLTAWSAWKSTEAAAAQTSSLPTTNMQVTK